MICLRFYRRASAKKCFSSWNRSAPVVRGNWMFRIERFLFKTYLVALIIISALPSCNSFDVRKISASTEFIFTVVGSALGHAGNGGLLDNSDLSPRSVLQMPLEICMSWMQTIT